MIDSSNAEPLLRVEELSVSFRTDDEKEVEALDRVSFEINEGQTIGLVGESGCGKSVTAYSIMRLLPQPLGRITSGMITFGNKPLLELSAEEMREIRGNEIGMIFSRANECPESCAKNRSSTLGSIFAPSGYSQPPSMVECG